MEFDKALRVEWVADSRLEFFKAVRPLFKNLTKSDVKDIESRLAENDEDYFDIAAYDTRKNEPFPKWILVCEGRKIYTDFLDPRSRLALIEKIETLANGKAQKGSSRKLDEDDWTNHLMAMGTSL